MSRCRYCDTEITWMKDGRKNIPVENDGAQHECKQYKNMRQSIRKMEPTDIEPDVLKQYQENMKKELEKRKKKS